MNFSIELLPFSEFVNYWQAEFSDFQIIFLSDRLSSGISPKTPNNSVELFNRIIDITGII